MPRQAVEQLTFNFLPDKPLVVQTKTRQMTTDPGLLLFRQYDQQWDYSRRLAACLTDDRQDPEHTILEMLRQRLYGILADYEDCNDHDTLRDDPIFKLLADRLPEDDALASQPTLSRFENAAGTCGGLQRMVDFLITTGIERLAAKHGGRLPGEVTLDLDPTDDPCHGHQQLVFWHGYYDQYQYLPMVISEPTTQHVFLTWLRPGTLHAAKGAEDDLLRVAAALQAARPDIGIHVRGDADFGMPWMMDTCEQERFTYSFGLRSNPRLKRWAAPLLARAIAQYEQTNQKQRLFDCCDYQAASWPRPRRVIAKAECHAGGTNLRFIVTSRPAADAAAAEREYDAYVARGTSEQRMDELKNGLHADRLSCHRFKANFLRLLLHAAAYNLLAGLRDDASLPPVLRRGQPCTWRTHVIKVAATVVTSCRRVLVELAGQWPWWRLFAGVHERVLLHPAGP